MAASRKALNARGAGSKRQAAAAARIQRAYAKAAAALRATGLSPADARLNAALRDRLRATAKAWGGAAAAGRREDVRGFDRAEARIRRAERALRTPLARLREAGYTVRN